MACPSSSRSQHARREEEARAAGEGEQGAEWRERDAASPGFPGRDPSSESSSQGYICNVNSRGARNSLPRLNRSRVVSSPLSPTRSTGVAGVPPVWLSHSNERDPPMHGVLLRDRHCAVKEVAAQQ